jgi:hypothetical protein
VPAKYVDSGMIYYPLLKNIIRRIFKIKLTPERLGGPRLGPDFGGVRGSAGLRGLPIFRDAARRHVGSRRNTWDRLYKLVLFGTKLIVKSGFLFLLGLQWH